MSLRAAVYVCPSPQGQAVCAAGGVLRRTEMKLFLSARIHTPKPRITAPRICKERGSQWKPRKVGQKAAPEAPAREVRVGGCTGCTGISSILRMSIVSLLP